MHTHMCNIHTHARTHTHIHLCMSVREWLILGLALLPLGLSCFGLRWPRVAFLLSALRWMSRWLQIPVVGGLALDRCSFSWSWRVGSWRSPPSPEARQHFAGVCACHLSVTTWKVRPWGDYVTGKCRYLIQNPSNKLFAPETRTLTHFVEIITQRAACYCSLERPRGQGGSQCFLQRQPKALVILVTGWLRYLFDTETVAFQFMKVWEVRNIQEQLLNDFWVPGVTGWLEWHLIFPLLWRPRFADRIFQWCMSGGDG